VPSQTDVSDSFALRDHLLAAGCQAFAKGSEDYTRACRIWNGGGKHEPALIVRCSLTSEVQVAVKAARSYRVPISVKSGGNDWSGGGVADGSVVLDLSGMRGRVADRSKRELTFSGGALVSDVVARAEAAGLSVVTGYSGAGGMAGLLLRGGYGPLTSRLGLAADSLLEAKVVLEDGRLVTANETDNTDLFWALRGGGGNFGVVTCMRVRAHLLPTIVSGLIMFPWSDARTVLRGYADMMLSAPDELSVAAMLSESPGGNPIVALAPTWTGEPEEMRPFLARLLSLGKPFMTRVGPMTIGAMLSSYDDAQVVDGRYNQVQTKWLKALGNDAISTLVDAFESRTSRFSSVVLHHFHGAGSRVTPDATAFGTRDEHFTALIYSTWEQADDAQSERHRAWGKDLYSRLAPLALPVGYANLSADNTVEQVEAAYGGNARRLREVKHQYDPSNTFSSAIPLSFRVPLYRTATPLVKDVASTRRRFSLDGPRVA
jgi:FAD binding domain/Berberine and berberine like